ncbi:tetratricopeptide repeat protein [Maricaulis parjimensis]|uniref:tetratricopeptide repeat protein n=1 Tax=Maricaulis parjimensis TaxID=144023 RepID=UPI0019396A90|nr:tetratricopeptide repeat protein [Maricaulis parjimensis]
MRQLAALIVMAGLAVSGAHAQKNGDVSACMLGQLALSDAETETAIEQFELCLETEDLTPDQEVGVYAAMGAALLNEARYREALSAYNFAFAIIDTQLAEVAEPTLWRNRGIARLQLGQTEAALADLQRAANEIPDDVMTQLNLGILYQDLGRSADAVVAYDRVVRLEPDWMGAWINRSSALLDAGMTGAAVEDARRAVELEPDNGTTLNMLCWTLIQDGRAQTALPLCEQAVALEPESGAIVHSHATALEALGRLDEALPLYRRAWQLSPEDPEITEDYQRTHNP